MTRGRPKGMKSSKDKKSYGPLGDLVRNARLGLKLGLADLAKSCDCSVQFVSNIEHGRAPLPWDKVATLAKAIKVSVNEVQAANLAIRSDFIGFVGVSGKKVKKPEVLKNLTSIATSVSLLSSDSSIQEILKRYQNASDDTRKKFVKAALGLLV